MQIGQNMKIRIFLRRFLLALVIVSIITFLHYTITLYFLPNIFNWQFILITNVAAAFIATLLSYLLPISEKNK